MEASFSLGREVISWRQTKTTGETLCEKVVVRQFARAYNGISQALTENWITNTQITTRTR
jgi:hypothetical protein